MDGVWMRCAELLIREFPFIDGRGGVFPRPIMADVERFCGSDPESLARIRELHAKVKVIRETAATSLMHDYRGLGDVERIYQHATSYWSGEFSALDEARDARPVQWTAMGTRRGVGRGVGEERTAEAGRRMGRKPGGVNVAWRRLAALIRNGPMPVDEAAERLGIRYERIGNRRHRIRALAAEATAAGTVIVVEGMGLGAGGVVRLET